MTLDPDPLSVQPEPDEAPRSGFVIVWLAAALLLLLIAWYISQRSPT